MDVYDFVESADDAGFCGFSVVFESDVVFLSLIVGFVFVLVEDVVIAAGTEAFGVDVFGFLAAFAFFEFWFPVEFFVASVAEAFGMVLFLLMTIYTLFYHFRS